MELSVFETNGNKVSGYYFEFEQLQVISRYRARTPPPSSPKIGSSDSNQGGVSKSQKIDRGFTSKSDPKIWPARQIKGGFLGLRPEGGVLAL